MGVVDKIKNVVKSDNHKAPAANEPHYGGQDQYYAPPPAGKEHLSQGVNIGGGLEQPYDPSSIRSAPSVNGNNESEPNALVDGYTGVNSSHGGVGQSIEQQNHVPMEGTRVTLGAR